MLAVLIILGVLAYSVAGGIAFGYVASNHTRVESYCQNYREPEDFKEAAKEPEPWFGAIFWPITLLMFGVCGPLSRVAQYSWSKNEKSKERIKMRIKLEEKIRIAQEAAEKEAELEIEELLTHKRKL